MATDGKFIVITTINHPTPAVKKIAEIPDFKTIIVADKKTPADFNCQNTFLLSLPDQLALDSDFAKKCPYNHYSRKNIGYIKAIAEGATLIAETDDDNLPKENFLKSPALSVKGRLIKKTGWENIYSHFTDEKIWPRGFPLEYVSQSFSPHPTLDGQSTFDCPIQQYLADGEPDIDAICRLTAKTDINFRSGTVILAEDAYCPFNSQNTIWWPEAFPLLYLPCTATFRMTDIWRSFVAQVCLHKTGKKIAFHESTTFQKRNQHSIIKDFADEVPGYLNNAKIMELLTALTLSDKPHRLIQNMRLCYEKLVVAGFLQKTELNLLNLWLKDIKNFLH